MSKRKLRSNDLPPPENFLATQTEWLDVIKELESESDRAVALIGAAHLDTALESLLKASFAGGDTVENKLFNSPNAPLGTFSSRIAMAYGLGHIGPKCFKTLEAIREIRNAFAHHRRIMKFEDPAVREWIKTSFALPYILPDPEPDLSLMRNRYIWTTKSVLGRISYAQSLATPPNVPENS